jgi:tetratricopeptide (TPR) repeat protein
MNRWAIRTRAREHWELATRGDSEPTSALYYNDAPPELIFYQGLALQKLGREDEAKGRFNRLIDYGEKHLFDEVTIDYFAVSLPDFLIFEEDLQRRNELHCRLVMGLGHLGGERYDRAEQELSRVLAIDPAHQGALRHLQMARTGLGSS